MFAVDRSLPTALPTQIAAGLRALVASGQLAAGDRVPSTRELARQIGVSRGSVVAAYEQLLSEGFLLSSQGAPTVVHPELSRLTTSHRPTYPQPRARSRKVLSLKPASGHAGTIRPAAWRRAWREAAAEPPAAIDKAGQPLLRSAIAEHLRLARGFAADPDNVLVSGGSREGLLLILMTLGRNLRVGVEDPGHPGLRNIIPLAGHTLVTCPTDGRGLVVEALPSDLDVVVVTPSHLYPLGGSMPAPRRAALLTWAARQGVVVIEDDYNTELRYRVSPQPTLAALTSEADVVALGTFSTLLSKQLNAGYVVAGPALAQRLRETRDMLGMPVSPVTQHAIAQLLDGGYVRRNTRSVHRRLTQRREALRERVFPVLRDLGAEIEENDEVLGVDIVVRFADDAQRAHLEFVLAARDVEWGRVGTSTSGELLLSFGHLDDSDFETAVTILAGATPR